jgi:hypothetical protein
VQGRVIVVTGWLSDAVFAATAVPVAFGVGAFDVPAIVTALSIFALSLAVWIWAFGISIVRSTRGDEIAVASLFVSVGDAPGRVRAHLFGALGACLALTAGTAAANPFGVLVPMLPLGLVGLWAARHGGFPPRRDRAGSHR